jgi:tRNA(adenine34) deaminase
MTLYTTMEPCPMCAGAMLQAKIGTWVVGGRFKSVGRTDLGQYSIESFTKFVGADVQITSGVLQQECETLRGRFYLRK